MKVILRIVAIATFFLGLGLLTGEVGGISWQWLHLFAGLGTVALAAISLGPWTRRSAGAPSLGGVARISWWWPLIPFCIGLTLFLGLWSGGQVRMLVIAAHVVAGVAERRTAAVTSR